MIDLFEKGSAKFGWWRDWRGECVAIVGSGPSAKKAGVEQLRDRINVIAINENYRLCPFADILYSCDAEWWKLAGGEARKFSGTRIGFNPASDGVAAIGILRDTRGNYDNTLQFQNPGLLGSGGNSGFQMINLAAQFGATAIALIGFDMRLDHGVHWHGMHRPPMRNPDQGRCNEWIKHLDGAAGKLKLIGVDVVNCSEISMLKNYPKMTIEQALRRWGL